MTGFALFKIYFICVCERVSMCVHVQEQVER